MSEQPSPSGMPTEPGPAIYADTHVAPTPTPTPGFPLPRQIRGEHRPRRRVPATPNFASLGGPDRVAGAANRVAGTAKPVFQ